MSDVIARSVDHEIWDHPGLVVPVRYAIRKYRDRPALRVGELVTIVRFARIEGLDGPEPRLLVRNVYGIERWIPATNVEL